jgi:endo-1,4-beta-xylanase
MNKLAFSWSMLILVSGGVLLTNAAAQRTHAQLAETETVSADATHAPIAAPLKWTSSGVLVSPVSDESHKIVSVKDPTVVHYDGLWHVYATAHSTSARTWSMVYLNFKDWPDAPKAKLTYIDVNPGLRGYSLLPYRLGLLTLDRSSN